MRVLNKRHDVIPPDAVYVGRPSKWGNPMTVKEVQRLHSNLTKGECQERAVMWYGHYLEYKPDLMEQLGELKGKDLVCWCSPLSCHADVLLELAQGYSVKEEE